MRDELEILKQKLIETSSLEGVEHIKELFTIVERQEVLLKATKDILDECAESSYILDVMEATAFYDGTTCDGACLLDDIKLLFGEI